jgi:hypothetical protein
VSAAPADPGADLRAVAAARTAIEDLHTWLPVWDARNEAHPGRLSLAAGRASVDAIDMTVAELQGIRSRLAPALREAELAAGKRQP